MNYDSMLKTLQEEHSLLTGYRPQTKFAKVRSMFLHMSSVPHPGQVHPQAGSPSFPAGQVPPGRYTPQAGTTPQQVPLAGTPPWQAHPLWPGTPPPSRYIRTPPSARYPPRAVHAGRYGQQAGGTHPTGMHSCWKIVPQWLSKRIFLNVRSEFSVQSTTKKNVS